MLDIGLYLTWNCNQACKFCFKKNEPDSHISDKNLDFFCEWCRRNGIKQVKVAGGEPTTHPNFSQHMETIKDKLGVLAAPQIITNLSCAEEKVVSMSDTDILVNVAVDRDIEETQRFGQNMRKLIALPGTRITLAYTLHNLYQMDCHIPTYCREFGIKRVRLDFARASILRKNEYVTLEHIDRFKPKLLALGRKIADEGAAVFFDCPIPRDLFTIDELKSMNVAKARYIRPGSFSCEMIYINPDLSISSCPFRTIGEHKLPAFADVETLWGTVMTSLAKQAKKGKDGEFLCPAERYM